MFWDKVVRYLSKWEIRSRRTFFVSLGISVLLITYESKVSENNIVNLIITVYMHVYESHLKSFGMQCNIVNIRVGVHNYAQS